MSSISSTIRQLARPLSSNTSTLLHAHSHAQRNPPTPPLLQPVDGFSGAVGNTPLIRLKSLCRQTGCDILGKAEFQNPGGSVKDRAALWMVRDEEEKGRLKPGGTVVEGTAGNTGIGLAHVCRSRGYRCIIYMPDTQSQEKIDLLRMLGAEVHAVPAVPFDDPQNYNHRKCSPLLEFVQSICQVEHGLEAARCAESLTNAVWTNQFDNIANRAAHIESTGPEIWNQAGAAGGLDGFVCATGTGGTLAGVTRYLKDASAGRVKCFLADPPGSVLYNFIKSGGKLSDRVGGSITEGIGQGRITSNLRPEVDSGLIDDAVFVSDEESIQMVYRMLDEEGIYLGASSALNVVAAVKMAEQLGKGRQIVTVLCDGASKYQSRLFSKSWLKSKKLYDSLPSQLKKYAILN